VDHPVTFCNSPGYQESGYLIGLVVKLFPGDFLTTVFRRLPFYECCFRTVHTGISGQYLSNQHKYSFPYAKFYDVDIKPALNGQDAQKKWVTVDGFRDWIFQSRHKALLQAFKS
jgi:hypothetical protein